MIAGIEWRMIASGNDSIAYDHDSITYVAEVPGGMLIRTVEVGGQNPVSSALCFVPSPAPEKPASEKFKEWLEAERQKENERARPVTHDLPHVDASDDDAM